MRDAIDDDGVLRLLGHLRSAPLHHLRLDTVPRTFLVHLANERGRKAVLAANQKADRFRCARYRTHLLRSVAQCCSVAWRASPRRSTLARVSVTMWRTTAFRSPVARN